MLMLNSHRLTRQRQRSLSCLAGGVNWASDDCATDRSPTPDGRQNGFVSVGADRQATQWTHWPGAMHHTGTVQPTATGATAWRVYSKHGKPAKNHARRRRSAVHIRYGSGEGGTRWEGNDGRAGGRRRVRCAVQFFAQAIDSCGLTPEPSVGRSVRLSV